MKDLFERLAEGGGFSLPYLLRISTPDKSAEVFVINDNEDLEWNGHTYKASNFKYNPRNDGDSNLEIEVAETDALIDIMEGGYYLDIEAVGVLYDGEVEEIRQYRHKYGEGTWTGKSLQLKLNKDDRMDMSKPAFEWNTYNNRGNS